MQQKSSKAAQDDVKGRVPVAQRDDEDDGGEREQHLSLGGGQQLSWGECEC